MQLLFSLKLFWLIVIANWLCTCSCVWPVWMHFCRNVTYCEIIEIRCPWCWFLIAPIVPDDDYNVLFCCRLSQLHYLKLHFMKFKLSLQLYCHTCSNTWTQIVYNALLHVFASVAQNIKLSLKFQANKYLLLLFALSDQQIKIVQWKYKYLYLRFYWNR